MNWFHYLQEVVAIYSVYAIVVNVMMIWTQLRVWEMSKTKTGSIPAWRFVQMGLSSGYLFAYFFMLR